MTKHSDLPSKPNPDDLDVQEMIQQMIKEGYWEPEVDGTEIELITAKGVRHIKLTNEKEKKDSNTTESTDDKE